MGGGGGGGGVWGRGGGIGNQSPGPPHLPVNAAPELCNTGTNVSKGLFSSLFASGIVKTRVQCSNGIHPARLPEPPRNVSRGWVGMFSSSLGCEDSQDPCTL